MPVRIYPLLLLFGLFLVWGAFAVALPTDYQRDILAPQGERDRIYFGDTIVISQEFIPHAGLSGIDIPLGSTTYPSSPLIVHIRRSVQGQDIRTIPLFSFYGEHARFRFSPLWRVPDTLVWIVEAPHGPKDSFWVYREQDESVFNEGVALRGRQRIKGNIGFSEIWSYPRLGVLKASIQSSADDFAHWEYTSFFVGAVGLGLLYFLKRLRFQEKSIVVVSIIMSAVLHIWLGLTTPLIIDEGAYIQDVLQTSNTLLPFRDFLTKGPFYLFFLWLWGLVVPNTVIAWRLFSACVWALGSWWFWQLTVELGMKARSRLLAILAFTLMPAVLALTTPLLLQTVSVAVAIVGLLFALRAAKNSMWHFAAYAAIIFTIAFLIRVTAVIPACIALCILFVYTTREHRWKIVGTYVGVGVLLFGLVFGSAVAIVGLPKASVMINMEAFLISQNRQNSTEDASDSSNSLVRTMTIESRLLWREGVLLMAPVLLIPLVLVDRRKIFASSIILMATFLAGWTILFHLIDTNFLLPKTLPSTQLLILILFFSFPFITAMAMLLYDIHEQYKISWSYWRTPLLMCVWLFLTILIYAQWGRFRQSYLTEFLPQLAILCGISFDFMFDVWARIKPQWFSRFLIGMAIFSMIVSVYQGYGLAQLYPHSGTVDQASLVKIVRMITTYVPTRESIFTAQPIATAFSNRAIMFGYSHPGWYREARFGTVSEGLRDVLFRKPEEITNYLDMDANFVLTESRTEEIYFDGYPERIHILKTKFDVVSSVQNEMAGDTYTLYRRR